ncbi:MAG: hypothetical protein VX733_12020 [Candidatus Latescibacterota bacterium]|nr:hypothetical protein [Candidatus Latescibacterota bacterium]
MAEIYGNYQDLLDATERRAKSMEILGNTVDGSPIVAARGGGDKTPAIFITAGSHSTEHAGVSAAVQCVDELETDHRVFVIPTRDPIGLDGFAHALSLGLGEGAEFETFDDIEEILRSRGVVLFEEDDMVLALVGDYGYVIEPSSQGVRNPQGQVYGRLQRLHHEQPEVLAPLLGRRVYQTPGQREIEGTGDFDRAYTLIVALDGEILHINRFHDTVWAPVEPRVTVQLLERIRPGLSFDLHESADMDNRFWLSARHLPDEEGEEWEQRAARATIQAIEQSGAILASDSDAPSQWFDRGDQAVFWLDPSRRGEGYNLMDFCSRTYGMAFGTEMGMFDTFDHRVELAMITVRTAVSIFEERWC